MKLLREMQGVRYELFEMDALDEMALVVAEAFRRDEPMTVARDVPRHVFVDFVKLLAPKARREELTVLARDQETGRVIGAMIADDFASAPPEVRQWRPPGSTRFSLSPGVSTVACFPRRIHIDPTFGLVCTSTSSMNTAVSSAGSSCNSFRRATSFAARSGSRRRTTGRGRRHTKSASRSRRRTVSRLTRTP